MCAYTAVACEDGDFDSVSSTVELVANVCEIYVVGIRHGTRYGQILEVYAGETCTRSEGVTTRICGDKPWLFLIVRGPSVACRSAIHGIYRTLAAWPVGGGAEKFNGIPAITIGLVRLVSEVDIVAISTLTVCEVGVCIADGHGTALTFHRIA